MESYVVRIYRRAGRRFRILVGTVEAAGTPRKMAFSNIEDLWEILRRGKGRDSLAPQFPRRYRGREVRNGTAGADLEESAKECEEPSPPLDTERRDPMKRLFAVASIMILFSAAFFVVARAGAGPAKRPVRGMWTGTIYDLGLCADPTFPVPEGAITPALQSVNIGTGVFSHTGRSNFISSFCSALISDSFGVGSGWTILTASDGDTLHLSIEVEVDLSDFLANGGPVRWTEFETVAGGTGKFEGATGECVSQGTWTSGADPFPYGAGIMPGLFQPPQGWEGTTKGWISK